MDACVFPVNKMPHKDELGKTTHKYRESEKYIVMDGCVFPVNKMPPQECASQNNT